MTVKRPSARLKHVAAISWRAGEERVEDKLCSTRMKKKDATCRVPLTAESMSYLRRCLSKLAAALVGRTDAVMLMGHNILKTNTYDRVYSTGLRKRAWMGFAMTSL